MLITNKVQIQGNDKTIALGDKNVFYLYKS
jgi:hypothetical protein